MEIQENVLISDLTTMRIGGEAQYIIKAETADDLKSAYLWGKEMKVPLWMMGDGANTIGHDEGFDGGIILNRLKGIEILEEADDSILVKGASGEVWDDFVHFACERAYSGIEAMSKIPGTVGAAPVQNIGAYGQDIAQAIIEVEALDTQTLEFVTLQTPEMGLGYRHTRFNTGKDAGRFWITSVTMRLKKTQLKPPFYNSLQRYIDEHHETDFSPMNIRRMVAEIRAEKLPDPKCVASAGSFFKNVLLDKAEAEKAKARGIPVWQNADGSGKINSGWLIEQCGFKGKLLHGMRVSEKAALVLINESATSYADLAAARQEISDAVRQRFGYILQQEPVEIGQEK